MRNATSILAQAVSLATAQIEYKTDAEGNLVRVTETGKMVTREEIQHFLKNRRVVDREEVLEEIGLAWFKYMTQKGMLRKASNAAFYWITDYAAKVYDLPTPVVQGVRCEFPAA